MQALQNCILYILCWHSNSNYEDKQIKQALIIEKSAYKGKLNAYVIIWSNFQKGRMRITKAKQNSKAQEVN